MTADMMFGQLAPFLREPSTGGGPGLPLRRGSSRRNEINVAGRRHRVRYSPSSQAIDPLAYDSDGGAEEAAIRQAHNTAEADHDRTILELGDDPTDDHWALTPEQIDDMARDSISDAP